jgi:hypothetical protein
VNITLKVVVVLLLGWSVVSVIVALTVGGMAKARDSGLTPLLDPSRATGPMSRPLSDEGMRPAV